MSAVDRVEYEGEGLTEAELAPTPWQQASRWVDEANQRARAVPDVPEPAALPWPPWTPRAVRTCGPC